MNYLIVDIDHTLSDAAWRDPLIPDDHIRGDWSEYYRLQGEDDIIHSTALIVRSLVHERCFKAVSVTARSESYRDSTESWIKRHLLPIHEVIMRPRGDLTPSGELKVQLIKSRFRDLGEIALILEDRADCVDALKSLGRPIFQVHYNGGAK